MPNKTILIAAGGTGGHLYPAIAVADAVRRQRPDIRIIFAGTHDRIESREVPRAGYEFFPIAVEAPKKTISSMLTYPIKFSKAIFDGIQLMSRERPAAMLGGGAYLSVPTGIAAWSFHVPIALLEINSIAGTANKLLAWLADKLFIAYPESRTQFPTRVAQDATVCGTPVRADLGSKLLSKEEARTIFELEATRSTILVFGGSLGAKAINDVMEAIAGSLASKGLNILWQTGKSAKLEALQSKFRNVPNVHVMDYIYDMERAYAAADLVVCRAGASSLAELARLGKPAILVPYPYAAANHQEANARAFEHNGGAIVLNDTELKSKLEETITTVLDSNERRTTMSEAMKKCDNPNAASVVAKWLIERIP